MLKLKSLKILFALLGWITIQSTAIGHEFSEEHWFGSSNHICLTQASHLDDLLPTKILTVTPPTEVVYRLAELTNKLNVSTQTPNSRLTRAPPENS